jgi:hypothetical protein
MPFLRGPFVVSEDTIREELVDIETVLNDGALSDQGKAAATATKRALRWMLGEVDDLGLTATGLVE